MPLNDAKVVALVTASEKGDVSIRVHPEWRRIVQPRDHEYIETLYGDFKERAHRDLEALLKQLSFLTIGPLVTYETGPSLTEHPALFSLFKRFRET